MCHSAAEWGNSSLKVLNFCENLQPPYSKSLHLGIWSYALPLRKLRDWKSPTEKKFLGSLWWNQMFEHFSAISHAVTLPKAHLMTSWQHRDVWWLTPWPQVKQRAWEKHKELQMKNKTNLQHSTKQSSDPPLRGHLFIATISKLLISRL